MNIIFSIIAVFGFVASIVVPKGINIMREELARFGEEPALVKEPYKIGLVGSVILFVLINSFVIIPTGYTGVRVTFGQVDSQPVQSGLSWKCPFVQSIEKVNNKQQDIIFDKMQVWSETAARTAIYYEQITVTYTINPEYSAWIYSNVSDYKQALINEGIVASALKSSSKKLSDTDATNRSVIEPLCMENLQKVLDEKYGRNVAIINKVIIGNADFDESYNAAIAEKQQAQLEAERQAIENKRAIEKAEADAQVKMTAANAQAEATIIEAEAEAEANKLLEESLTENVLKEIWIEKWDGMLPHFVSGDSDSVMFGLDTGE